MVESFAEVPVAARAFAPPLTSKTSFGLLDVGWSPLPEAGIDTVLRVGVAANESKTRTKFAWVLRMAEEGVGGCVPVVGFFWTRG